MINRTNSTRSRKPNALNQMNHLMAVRRSLCTLIKSTPALRSLVSGHPGLETYESYLTNVWHYTRHSAAVIGLAGIRCSSVNTTLADYLFRYAQDELGRDRLATEDLATLGVTEKDLTVSKPLPSCAAMIGYEYYVAGHCNPVSLFGWLYMIEAMREDLGPVLSGQLSGAFSSSIGVRFVRAHGKAEELHTWDLTEEMMGHISPTDMAEVDHVADVVAKLYLGIFEQLPCKDKHDANKQLEDAGSLP
jgi:hypothetical protein